MSQDDLERALLAVRKVARDYRNPYSKQNRDEFFRKCIDCENQFPTDLRSKKRVRCGKCNEANKRKLYQRWLSRKMEKA